MAFKFFNTRNEGNVDCPFLHKDTICYFIQDLQQRVGQESPLVKKRFTFKAILCSAWFLTVTMSVLI